MRMAKRNWHWTLNRRLRRYGWDISRLPSPNYLTDLQIEIARNLTAASDLADFSKFFAGYASIFESGGRIHSQLGQEAFIIGFLGKRSNLRYLELGAYDPFMLSNTATLRETFNWTGLSIDPNPEVTAKFLKANLGESFKQVGVSGTGQKGILVQNGALTYVEALDKNTSGKSQEISLIGIRSLMEEITALDYLSIDIEGREMEVLVNFPFEKLKPRAITVEHNHRKHDSEEISRIMEKNGYRQVLAEITDYESWFFLEDSIGKSETNEIIS